jgi:hypothetical protein
MKLNETLGQPSLLGRTTGPLAAARRSTSSADEEAATDHRPVDESSAATSKTEEGQQRELPEGGGVEDSKATTRHGHATEEAGSAAFGVTPAAGRIAEPSPGHRRPCQGNRRAASQNNRARPPPRILSWIPPRWPSTSPTVGRSSPPQIQCRIRARDARGRPATAKSFHELCPHARAGSGREEGDRRRGGSGGGGRLCPSRPTRGVTRGQFSSRDAISVPSSR